MKRYHLMTEIVRFGLAVRNANAVSLRHAGLRIESTCWELLAMAALCRIDWL